MGHSGLDGHLPSLEIRLNGTRGLLTLLLQAISLVTSERGWLYDEKEFE